MKFNWPENMADRFGTETFFARHDLHESALFSDTGLASLLDRYPREKLGIYHFPAHGEGTRVAAHGRAPGISGEDLLQAVRAGEIWLNLRAVNRKLSDYAELSERLFGQLDAAAGVRTRKRDVGVLISSPKVQVHYHLDIPLVCLVQIRGVKRLFLYPTGAPYAAPSQVEAIAMRLQEEELEYRSDFENQVHEVRLEPGMALTWPQNAPHRVENEDCLNVSLSCEFMTLGALMRANALFTNGHLRRRLGLRPQFPAPRHPATVGKAMLARGLKLIAAPPPKAPTPITFELVSGRGEIVDIANG